MLVTQRWDVHLSGPEEKGLSSPTNRSLTNNVKHLFHIWANVDHVNLITNLSMNSRKQNETIIKPWPGQ